MINLIIFSVIIISAFALLLPFNPTNAGCCGCDPVYERNWHGEYIISAYVRDIACMDTSKIIATGTKGSVVKVIAETDGWYKVQLADGTTGWTGAQLIQITDKPLTGYSNPTTTASSLEKYLGYIFLAVEKNGEAYYFYPVDKKGYYLGRPADAFEIMRTLGLGATHDFIHNTSYYPDHVVGRILLDVEQNGEAYYIYPKDRKKYYLGRPADAFEIMRNLGLGISNTNLQLLSISQ